MLVIEIFFFFLSLVNLEWARLFLFTVEEIDIYLFLFQLPAVGMMEHRNAESMQDDVQSASPVHHQYSRVSYIYFW